MYGILIISYFICIQQTYTRIVTSNPNGLTHIPNRTDKIEGIPLYDIENRIDPYKTEESFCGVKVLILRLESIDIHTGGRRSRFKRSIVEDLLIQALVVTDPTVTTYYQDQDLEIYIYALIDMVNQIFHHYSLGYSIEIKLSSLIMLYSKPISLNMTSNADSYLKSFCAWQLNNVQNKSYGEQHINFYNTAILLTRKDICANNDTPCGTLGLAEVGSICQVERSCSIAEDTGLSTAFTIAHELGHLFGMKHDTMDNCNSMDHSSTLPYVMSPRLPQNLLSELMWSNCSHKDARIFIDRRFAKCLIAATKGVQSPNPSVAKRRNSAMPYALGKGKFEQYIDLDIDVEVDNGTAVDQNPFTEDSDAIENIIRNFLTPITANITASGDETINLKGLIAKAIRDMLEANPSLRSQNITVLGTILGHLYETPIDSSQGTGTVKGTAKPITTDQPQVQLFNISNVINIDHASDEIIELVSHLPLGAIFDMNVQCQLLFGIPNITYCSGIDEVCGHLWCKVGHKCMSKMRVPEDGTPCGINKWCMSKKCVSIHQTDLKNLKGISRSGNWGPWSKWSKCSRSCGIGLSVAQRKCDNPRPSNGGKFCLGPQRKYKTCNTEACRKHVDIRNLQCQKYGCDTMKKCDLNWTFDALQASFAPHTLCLLYCTSQGGQNFNLGYETIPNVEDGATCTPYENGEDSKFNEGGVCIEGVCHSLGCDKKLNSAAVRDECGICNGNNDTCSTINGNFSSSGFNITQTLQSTWGGGRYIPIGLLPQGSFDINVNELSASPNFLALVAENKTFVLNGNNTIAWNGEHIEMGITFTYKREPDEKETIEIKGSLKQPILVYHLALSELPSKDDVVEYSYKIYKDKLKASPLNKISPIFNLRKLFWGLNDWSPCSKTCGNGTQKATYACKLNATTHETNSHVVSVAKELCKSIPVPKKLPKIRSCNIAPCPAYWWIADWQPCPITCGAKAFQKRSVLCMQDINSPWGITHQVLPDSGCHNLVKPLTVKPCSLQLCPTLFNSTIRQSDSRNCTEIWCINNSSYSPCSTSTNKTDCKIRDESLDTTICNLTQGCNNTSAPINVTGLFDKLKNCTSLDNNQETLIFNNDTHCKLLYDYCKINSCTNITVPLKDRPFEGKKLIK